MGVIAGFVGFYSFAALKDKIGVPVSVAVVGWFACVIAASVCAVEIAIVGAVPLSVGLSTMFIYHALIGIIEAVITGIVVVLIFNVRPQSLPVIRKRKQCQLTGSWPPVLSLH